jgi:hypothetical protein
MFRKIKVENFMRNHLEVIFPDVVRFPWNEHRPPTRPPVTNFWTALASPLKQDLLPPIHLSPHPSTKSSSVVNQQFKPNSFDTSLKPGLYIF